VIREHDVVDSLATFYRQLDRTIPETAPRWLPDDRASLPRRPWKIQLLATGAVVVLLVGLALFFREASLDRAPVPAQSLPPLPAATLQVGPMRFFSASDGWVLTPRALMITHDGGTNWRDITPPTGQPGFCCDVVFFLDRMTGWVGALGGTPQTFHTVRTMDGGATWTPGADLALGRGAPPGVASLYPGPFTFLNAQLGWALVTNGLYSELRQTELLQTADGGATWTSTGQLPEVPFLGGWSLTQISPIRFIDPRTGWYLGSDSTDHEILYVTHDGGRTWAKQTIAVPSINAGQRSYFDLPTFVDRQHGFLAIAPPDGTVVVDVTTDGGVTWRMDTGRFPVFTRTEPFGLAHDWHLAPAFFGHGVQAIVLGGHLEVNTGHGWTAITPTGLPAIVQEIEFVNAQIGFARTTDDQCQGCSTREFLMKTVDGGRTWTPVTS
jgi:photosystem II stability/assembly factor-like uncharacterized protein